MSPSKRRQIASNAPHRLESISAVTLATHDMARAVMFYRRLGFVIRYGGEAAAVTSLHAGTGYLNLIAQGADRSWSWWARVIFYVSDVDALYRTSLADGLDPGFPPRDAAWGERYFHGFCRIKEFSALLDYYI